MSCGTDNTILRLIVQDVVSQLLKDGTLQGGLLDCNDKPLPAQRTVAQCNDLVDTVVTKFERIDRKLRITLSDKTELEVEIPDLNPPTVHTKRYHATAQLVLAANECGTAQRVVVGYHPDDVRDPDATVPVTDKDGTTLAWVYPTSAPEHSVPVRKDGTVIGYGVGAGVVTFIEAATETEGKPNAGGNGGECPCPTLISLGNQEIK